MIDSAELKIILGLINEINPSGLTRIGQARIRMSKDVLETEIALLDSAEAKAPETEVETFEQLQFKRDEALRRAINVLGKRVSAIEAKMYDITPSPKLPATQTIEDAIDGIFKGVDGLFKDVFPPKNKKS